MFNLIPDILYDGKLVKNFFRKVKLRDDAYQFTTLFTKYNIQDGETPEDVSFKFYQDINYYWILLLINDIQNVNKDWPMSGQVLEEYLKITYPDDLGGSIKHYETKEIKFNDTVILNSGLIVDQDFTFTYGGNEYTNITTPVTYREWEYRLNDDKKRIFVLKNNYLLKYEKEFKDLLRYDTKYGIRNNIRFNNV